MINIDNNAECVEADDDDSVLNLDDVACDKGQNVADAEQLALEQQHDKSLAMCFSLAKRGKAGYFIRDKRQRASNYMLEVRVKAL